MGLEVSQRTEGDPKGRSCAQSHKFKAAARSALLFRKVATTGTGLFFGSSEVASTTSSAPYAHLLQHVTDGRRSARLGPPGELGCFAWTEGRQTAGPLPSPPRAVRILDPGQLAPSTELDDMDLDNPFDLLGLLQVGGLPFRAGSAPLHMPIPNTPPIRSGGTIVCGHRSPPFHLPVSKRCDVSLAR